MGPPSLNLAEPVATRREALAEQVPGAWVGMKIAALLLVEGQRPGWIAAFRRRRSMIASASDGAIARGLTFGREERSRRPAPPSR